MIFEIAYFFFFSSIFVIIMTNFNGMIHRNATVALNTITSLNCLLKMNTGNLYNHI